MPTGLSPLKPIELRAFQSLFENSFRREPPKKEPSRGEYSASACRIDDLTDGIYDEARLVKLDVMTALLRDNLFPAR